MKCQHKEHTLIYSNIIAHYEKRKGGEPFSAQGDYAKCKKCKGGIFIPYLAHLSIVPCEIEFNAQEEK